MAEPYDHLLEKYARLVIRVGVNVDVVIGSPEVQIDGIHADGSVVAVTRGDEFVLDG
jgi:leucyl aminopeptidase (aminopeptidase T)